MAKTTKTTQATHVGYTLDTVGLRQALTGISKTVKRGIDKHTQVYLSLDGAKGTVRAIDMEIDYSQGFEIISSPSLAHTRAHAPAQGIDQDQAITLLLPLEKLLAFLSLARDKAEDDTLSLVVPESGGKLRFSLSQSSALIEYTSQVIPPTQSHSHVAQATADGPSLATSLDIVRWFAGHAEGKLFIQANDNGLEIRAYTPQVLGRAILPCVVERTDEPHWTALDAQGIAALSYLAVREPEVTIRFCESVLYAISPDTTIQIGTLPHILADVTQYLQPRSGFAFFSPREELLRALRYLSGASDMLAGSGAALVISGGVVTPPGTIRMALMDGDEGTFVDIPGISPTHNLFCFGVNPKYVLSAVEALDVEKIEFCLDAPLDMSDGSRTTRATALCLRPWVADARDETARWIVQPIRLARSLTDRQDTILSPTFLDALAQAGLSPVEPDKDPEPVPVTAPKKNGKKTSPASETGSD